MVAIKGVNASPSTPSGGIMTQVIGLDLSLAATGIARPDGTLDTIRPNSRDDHGLVEVIADLMIETAPVLGGEGTVVLQDLPTGIRNAAARALGMLHGAVRLTFQRHNIRYLVVPPATLKAYATGRRNGQKPDMRMELYKRTGVDVDDETQCDAAWLRHLGLDLLGRPEIELPESHRRALDKLAPTQNGMASPAA
jgi:hypothetical protein